MRLYRLFIFDRFGAKVEDHREFHAPDDETAVKLSQGWRSARKAQLWRSDYQVSVWENGARLPSPR